MPCQGSLYSEIQDRICYDFGNFYRAGVELEVVADGPFIVNIKQKSVKKINSCVVASLDELVS